MAKDRTLCITKEDKIEKLAIIATDAEFYIQLALEQYMGVNNRPYVCVAVQRFAPGSSQITKGKLKFL